VYGEAPAASAAPTFVVEADEALTAWAADATEQLLRFAETHNREFFGGAKPISNSVIQAKLKPLITGANLLRVRVRAPAAFGGGTRFWADDGSELTGLPDLAHKKIALSLTLEFLWSRSDGWGALLEANHVQIVGDSMEVDATVQVCPF
jgi:hypothetical protein